MRLLQDAFLLSLLLLFSQQLNAQDIWSLDRCIAYAIENNIEVQRSNINVEIAENNYKSAKANLLPGVNSDMGYNVNYGRSLDPTTYEFVTQQIKNSSLSLNAGLDVFTGGNKINSIKQNEYQLRSNELLNEDVKNNIALQVTSSYLQVLLSKENIKTIQQQLSISLEQYRQTELMFERGAVAEGNVLEVAAQVSNDTVSLIQAQNSYIINLIRLQQLLQLEVREDFRINDPQIELPEVRKVLTQTAEEVYQTALSQQPIIESNKYAEMSSKRALKAARGLYYPSIRLVANLRTTHSSLGRTQTGEEVIQNPPIGYVAGTNETVLSFQDAEIPVFDTAPFYEQYNQNFNQTVGVSMSIPILNGLQRRYNVKNAQLQLEQQKLNSKNTRNQMKNDVYVAYNDAKLSYQTYKARQKALSATKRSFEYVEKRFNVGAANQLEYTTAKTNFANAQVNLLSAKYDYLFKTKVLDFYLGIPITLNE